MRPGCRAGDNLPEFRYKPLGLPFLSLLNQSKAQSVLAAVAEVRCALGNVQNKSVFLLYHRI